MEGHGDAGQGSGGQGQGSILSAEPTVACSGNLASARSAPGFAGGSVTRPRAAVRCGFWAKNGLLEDDKRWRSPKLWGPSGCDRGLLAQGNARRPKPRGTSEHRRRFS